MEEEVVGWFNFSYKRMQQSKLMACKAVCIGEKHKHWSFSALSTTQRP